MKAVAARLAGDPGDEGLQRLARHKPSSSAKTPVGHVDAAEHLGQRHDAEPHRLPGRARRPRGARALVGGEPDDLRRAAADVEHHDRPGVAVGEIAARRPPPDAPPSRDRRSRARRRAARAPRRRIPRRSPAARQASVAIVRARVTPRAAILSRQTLQRRERALDRRLAQPPGQRQALAQPDDAREGVDDPEPVGGRPRDQQAAVVGAEIERRIGRQRMADGWPLRRLALRAGPDRGTRRDHI